MAYLSFPYISFGVHGIWISHWSLKHVEGYAPRFGVSDIPRYFDLVFYKHCPNRENLTKTQLIPTLLIKYGHHYRRDPVLATNTLVELGR